MMLKVKDLQSGYGKKQVLFGLSLQVQHSEIVALIGPNGAGKSTVLKAVCGLIPLWQGDICFNGISISGSTPAENFAQGIAYSPQGNCVFSDMTVLENLEIGGFRLSYSERRDRIGETLRLFPLLKDRLSQEAGRLSGGEQQMLGLARALVPRPKLLMLDEPSLGLSPKLVKLVFEKITQINRDSGVSILIVEQKVRDILEICNKVYSIKLGRMAFSGEPSDLQSNREKLKQLFLR